MPQCGNCQNNFESSLLARAFYQKIAVPEPKFCPSCRCQRRLAFRNERTLYRRKCDLTGKPIISIYSPEAPFPVYDPDAWFSDSWDDLAHGRPFDFNRPFFEQFYELQNKAPKMGLHVMNVENSPYVNQCWYTKNSYLCFDMGFVEDGLYCYTTYHSKNVTDTSYTFDTELAYWLVDCRKCYECMYLQDCSNCTNAYFSFDSSIRRNKFLGVVFA